MYDVELVNILREDQMEQLEQQNIVLNYNVRLAKLPSERLIYETQEVRINQSLAEKIRWVVFDGVPNIVSSFIQFFSTVPLSRQHQNEKRDAAK